MASPVRDVALAARVGTVHGRAYFAVQAAAGLLWWVLVFSVPEVRIATLGLRAGCPRGRTVGCGGRSVGRRPPTSASVEP